MSASHRIALAIAALAVSEHDGRADPSINFYGDVDYYVEHTTQTTNSFQAPDLDIFATQSEGKFQFVGELIVEAFGQNDFTIDADRLEVDYKPTSWLRFRAGRLRSAFGYYGDAYQNGKFFMLATSWPEMYQGEGYDGIVPSHTVGLHADTSRELGGTNGRITLDAEVINGRGPELDEVTAFQDQGNHKGVDFRLRYVGEGALDGFLIGANVYNDDIPPDTRLDYSLPEMHELILGGHTAYMSDHIHVIAEAAWFRHRELGTQTIHTTLSLFGEAGYGFGDYMPYVRYEIMRFSDSDPYFTGSGFPTIDHQRLTVGTKYAASASVALKLEGSVNVSDGENDYRTMAQAAFAF
jgi:hypothetical protein